jgi:hypothetical protein
MMRWMKSIGMSALAAAVTASPVSARAETDAAFDIVGALMCKLDAPDYIGFAMNFGDDETGYRSLGWVKEASGTPFLSQYRLPAPIEVAGQRTSTIVFSGSGIAAVLDIADPASVAARLGVVNTIMSREAAAAALGLTPQQAAQLPPVTSFRGERVVTEKIDDDAASHMRVRRRIVQSVANDRTYPGKTLLGCSYSLDIVAH